MLSYSSSNFYYSFLSNVTEQQQSVSGCITHIYFLFCTGNNTTSSQWKIWLINKYLSHVSHNQPLCKYIKNYRAALSGNCKVSFCKTSFVHTALSVKGAKIWNSVLERLKSAAHFTTFKRLTKSCLIQQQTCTHV